MTLQHNIFVSWSLFSWFRVLHGFDTLRVQLIPQYTVFCYMNTHQTNKCLVNLEHDLSPEKGSKYCLTWKVSTPLPNLLCFNDTRLQESLLSGTDTRSCFQTPRVPALVNVLFMSGLDISAVCPSGEVTGWKYRVSSKYIHRRTLSNSVCLTLVVTS